MAKNYRKANRKTRSNRKANRKTRRNSRSRRNTRRNNMNVMLGGFQGEEKMMTEYKNPFVTNMVKY